MGMPGSSAGALLLFGQCSFTTNFPAQPAASTGFGALQPQEMASSERKTQTDTPGGELASALI
jgi:hypothetical protein